MQLAAETIAIAIAIATATVMVNAKGARTVAMTGMEPVPDSASQWAQTTNFFLLLDTEGRRSHQMTSHLSTSRSKSRAIRTK